MTVDARPVLIAGAGPTGMTLALQLHRLGVPVRLIDKRAQRRAGSKALSINPATLYLFDELGVADAVTRAGRRLTRATLIARGKRLASVDLGKLPYRHHHFVMLPQPETERILEERLLAAGVAVERGARLDGVRPIRDGVAATVVGSYGEARTVECSYLVGCDGPDSVVRSWMGAAFSGVDDPLCFVMADARVDWAGPRDQGFYLLENGSFVVLLPLTDTHHRVVVMRDRRFDEGRAVTFAEVCAAVEACVGGRLRLRDPIWTSGAPFYNRLASAVRRGRVFIAGDAAHLFSPLGGYGMNTGVGDAFNLGWKLAYALRGRGGERLLATYEPERLGLARRLVQITDRSTSLAAGLGRHTPEDEEAWRPVARNRGNLRRLPYNLSGLGHSYEAVPSGRAGAAVLAGCVAPFVDVVRDPAAGGAPGRGRHLLVVNVRAAGAARGAWLRAMRDIQGRCRDFLDLFVFDERSPGVHGLDACGFPDPGLALVRPDLIVERVGRGVEPWHALGSYLDETYGAGARAAEPARTPPAARAACEPRGR